MIFGTNHKITKGNEPKYNASYKPYEVILKSYLYGPRGFNTPQELCVEYARISL